MVILGGLEFVAAGYVLHELGKDGDKARVTAENRRRRRHGSHSHHRRRDSDSRPRPPRPTQQSLAPPVIPPPRPNSAPPHQIWQPQGGPTPGAGPWMNGPPPQQQRPPQFAPQGPPHPQSWPVQGQPPRPNNQPPPQQGPNSPMYKPADFPTNPNMRPPFQQGPPAPPPQYQQHPPQGPPPPGPAQMPRPPTLHYDTKTGKWQSNMLPPDSAPRSGSAPPDEGRARSGSNNLAPPSRLREQHRAYSAGSYSSDSDSDSSEDDLAYGSLPGQSRHSRRQRAGSFREAEVAKVASYERTRPVELRAEEDWYARGREERVGNIPVGFQGNNGNGGKSRAGTMPAELDSRPRYELA